MTLSPAPAVHAFGVTGVGELRAGDDLAAALLEALAAMPAALLPGDVLVVSSKVVSKVLGLTVTAAAADRADLVAGQTLRLVARRRTPAGLAQVVQAVAGPVMAAAGVDLSNVGPGLALLLPADPDAEARRLRARLLELGVEGVGVVLSDTAGRAWRDGQTDFALGAAGLRVTEDLRGGHDTHGQPLEVTLRALADQIAGLADLVKGKLTGVPAAVVRGLESLVTDDDGPGAASLLRPAREDWFRLGHVEAVSTSLGLDPADHEPPAVPPEPVAARLARVIDAALAAPDPLTGQVLPATVRGHDQGRQITLARTTDLRHEAPPEHEAATGHEAALGALAQRLVVLAWAEDLRVDLARSGSSSIVVGAAEREV